LRVPRGMSMPERGVLSGRVRMSIADVNALAGLLGCWAAGR